MRSSTLSLMAICLTTALAQTGANCNIVANQTVKAGDTLAAIAKSANVTLDQIQFVNTQITNPRSIKAGDVIKIPDLKCVAPAAKPLAEPTATCSNGTAKTTTVVAGDTLNIIAKEKLGITLPALLAANTQIKNPDVLNVGDVINIPLCNNGTSSGGAANSKAGGGTVTKSATGKVSAKAVDPTGSTSSTKSKASGMKAPKTTPAGDGAGGGNAAAAPTISKTKISRAPKTTPADGNPVAQANEPTNTPSLTTKTKPKAAKITTPAA
ncbi:carbohydrate-binding module family 50 protein [Cadophora sp. DSE1049]|nr:carbohydrate-binding module family 50 protein [Cadophora sp. DSE1049]